MNAIVPGRRVLGVFLLAAAALAGPAVAAEVPAPIRVAKVLPVALHGFDSCWAHYAVTNQGNLPDRFLLPGFARCQTSFVGIVHLYLERAPGAACPPLGPLTARRALTSDRGAHACEYLEVAQCPTGYHQASFSTCAPSGTPIESKQPPGCPVCGNPINFATGEKFQRERDYAAAGPSALVFERYYSSRRSMPVAWLGPGWRHTFDAALVLTSLGVFESVQAQRPDGRVLLFTTETKPDAWRADPDVTERLRSVHDDGGVRTGFELTLADDTRERYDAQGHLQAITPRGGHTLGVTTDARGRAVAVSDPSGRTLALEYGDEGRLSALVDPAGGRHRYGYDAHGRLAEVRYPDATPHEPGDDPVRRYHYEDARFPGHLSGVSDENGVRAASWGYDDAGRAVRSEHAGGTERTQVQYQADGSVGVTDALGREHRYTLGLRFGVRRVLAEEDGACDGCGGSAATAYDPRGFVAARTHRNGATTRYVHDERGLELSRTEAAGTPQERNISTRWHPVLRLPVRIEGSGKVITFDYDASGRLLTRSERDPVTGRTRTTTRTYTEDGLLASVDGPRTDVADVTTFEHANGDLVKVTNALGHVTRITAHDAHGRALALVDANGLETTLAYDARGRLTERRVGERVTRFAYDAVGNLTRVELPDGSALEYRYDEANRLVGVIDALGNRIAYTLDAAGNRTGEAVYAPDGTLTRQREQAFDALGRLVRTLGGEGQERRFEHDAAGNLAASVDGEGRRTTHAYDALARLVATTDALGGITRYGYDARDNLVSVTDPRGLVTRYGHDALDDLVLLDSPDTGRSEYLTDAAGNRVRRTDARGVTAHMAYDALDRLTGVRYPDPALDETYVYDQGEHGIGRLTAIGKAGAAVTYRHDAHGNVVQKSQQAGGGTLAVGYAHDALDRIASVSYPSGAQVRYARGAAGQVAAVELVRDGVTRVLAQDIGHRPFGPAQGMTLGNGFAEARGYDRDGRLVALHGDVQVRSYSHDGNDNVTAIDDGLRPQASQAFGYDALDRLGDAQGPYGVLAFDYDAVGNRTRQTGPAGIDAYTYDEDSNRLLAVTGPNARALAHDAAGNTVGRDAHAYAYDDTGRLSEVRVSGSLRAVMTYNALGERVARGTGQGVQGFLFGVDGALLAHTGPDGAGLREYVYLDGEPLARLEAGGEATTVLRVWKTDPGTGRLLEVELDLAAGTMSLHEDGVLRVFADELTLRYSSSGYLYLARADLDAGGVLAVGFRWNYRTGAIYPVGLMVDTTREDGTRLFARLKGSVSFEELHVPGTTASIAWYHADHLGTPQALSDESGRIVWRGDYLPFGEVVDSVAETDQDLRFPGQFVDDEVGGYYNYRRYYDPSTGRYLTSDPIGLAGGVNTYAYVGGNPIIYSDPTGLVCGTGACVGAAVVLVHNARTIGLALSRLLGPSGARAVGTGVGIGVGASIPVVSETEDTDAETDNCPPIANNPAIPDVTPGDLCEQLALAEAKAGAGEVIITGLGDEPRLIAHYGAGPWVKKQHTHMCVDGRQLVIHYFHSLTTGENVELKFVRRM